MTNSLPGNPANPALWAFLCAVAVGDATALIARQRPELLAFHPVQITGFAFVPGGAAAFARNAMRRPLRRPPRYHIRKSEKVSAGFPASVANRTFCAAPVPSRS
jgi:hypothetical protein